jgi:NADH-quinone oxidoreductase subunit G
VLSALGRLAAKVGVVKDGWNGFNVLHHAAARVGGLDMGFVPASGGLSAQEMVQPGALDVLFLLGADEIETGQSKAFKVYLGSHGDRGAHRADVILPGAAYTEENGLFVNTEGRPQLAMRAGFAPGEAKENWAILRALSAELGHTLPFDSMAALRHALVAAHPHLGQIDAVPENIGDVLPLADTGRADFRVAIHDFYLTNPIARASSLMAELSAADLARGQPRMAAE